MRPRFAHRVAVLAGVVLLAPGCSSNDDTAATTLASTSTASPTTTAAPETTITTNSDAEAEVLAAVEGLAAAINSYDTEAARDYVTDDYTWQSTGPVQDLEEYLAYVDKHYKNVGFQVEVAEELVVSRDGEVYVVEDSGVVTANNLELTGVTTHRLVEVDGEWLIQESRWVESNG